MLILIIAAIVAANIYLLIKKVNIGYIMFLNVLWIIIGRGLSFSESLGYLQNGIMGRKTLNLISVFMIILLLESLMRRQGYIRKMVDGLMVLFGGSLFAPCIMPIFIGMLPSPGGARLSCPMVDETTSHTNHQVHKAFTNYWYRHIWMDGFILYPPMILAAKILDVDVLSLFLNLLPMMALWFIIGSFVGLRRFERTEKSNGDKKAGFKLFLSGVYPIILLITVYIVLLQTSFSLPLQAAGLSIILLLMATNKIEKEELRANMKDMFKVKFAIIIFGAITFSEFFNGAGYINDVVMFMDARSIPTQVLYIVLPFITGLMSGISLTFVSVSFPILAGLGLGESSVLFLLAYTSGVIGVMLTPLHLCSVVSAEYFKVPIQKLMVKVAISCLILLPALIVLYAM